MCMMVPVETKMKIKIIGPATDGDRSRIGQTGRVLYHNDECACMVFVKGMRTDGHGERLGYNIYKFESLAVWQGAGK